MRTTENFSVAYLEAKGKAIIWNAYAEYFASEDIMEEGFNPNSGYVYLFLDNGVTIASAFGQDVEFIVYDQETDDELFFDSIDELNNHLNK